MVGLSNQELIMKQIIIVIGILLVIITGVVVVALWQQSYAPPEPTGPFWVIDDVGRNVTIHT